MKSDSCCLLPARPSGVSRNSQPHSFPSFVAIGLIVIPVPDTRRSLLLRLKDPEDQQAWEEFVRLYQPVIYRVASARGLQHADSQDVTQTVFISIARSVREWEPANPSVRFRHWLLRVAKNATINAVTRRPPDQNANPLDDTFTGAVGNGPTEALVEQEYQRELYFTAARSVQADIHPDTWRAFEMTTLDGLSVETAASELQKTVGTIYAARSRVLRRLTAAVAQLKEAYEC